MAYKIDGASSQYVSTSSAPISTLPVTLACFEKPSNTNAIVLVYIGKSTLNYDRCQTVSKTNLVAAAGASQEATVSGASINWQHAGGRWASSKSRIAYLNGTAGTEDTNTEESSNWNQIAIGARYNGAWGPFNSVNVEIAEAAIWSVVLTDAEIASLAKGFSPRRIRPQSLVFYAPLLRNLQDLRGGLALTNNNTATIANHPRVY